MLYEVLDFLYDYTMLTNGIGLSFDNVPIFKHIHNALINVFCKMIIIGVHLSMIGITGGLWIFWLIYKFKKYKKQKQH